MMPEDILEYFCINPSNFIIDWDTLCKKFPVFEKLKSVRSNPKWHGEESVFKHTQMVCEYWFKHIQEEWIQYVDSMKYPRKNLMVDAAIMLPTLLLHDIGKSECEIGEDGYVRSGGHEELSAKLAQEILFPLLPWYKSLISILIKLHDLRYAYRDMKPKSILKRVNYLKDACCLPGQTPLEIYDDYLKVVFKCDYNGAIHSKEICDDIDADTANLRKYFEQPEMRVMFGLPGSGKNYKIEQNGWSERYVIISRDDIREELFGDKGCHDDEEKVTKVFNKRLMEAIERRDSIIINNTNLKMKYRKVFYDLCSVHNYKYVVDTCERPLEYIYEVRPGKQWKEIIQRMLSEIEYPIKY